MKRKFDDEPVPAKRVARDRDGIKDLLPEHVGVIAEMSLEVLFGMAFVTKRWFGIIQERNGAHIRYHEEWCPALRPLVDECFRNARQGEFALEIPLVDPGPFSSNYVKDSALSINREANDNQDFTMIPWSVSVEQWIKWNAWAKTMPPGDLAGMNNEDNAINAALAQWVDSFQVFPVEWLEGEWTVRRRLLIEETLAQAHYFLVRLTQSPKKAGYVIMLQYLAILETTLRRIWARTGHEKPVLNLIDLFNRWPVLNHAAFDEFALAYDEFANDDYDAFYDFPKAVAAQLMPFALASHGRNFAPVFRASEVSLHTLLDLPTPVKYVLREKMKPTPFLCKALGDFAHVKVGDALVDTTYLLTVSKNFFNDVPKDGAWKEYWKELDEGGLVQEFTDALWNNLGID